MKYECDCYDNSFAYKGNLETHFITAHEGMKPYKCDYCEKTLGTLEIHTKSSRNAILVIKHSVNMKIW